MRRSKKAAVAEETSLPPSVLTPTQSIAQVIKSDGKSVWTCTRPDGRNILVELPSRFHNTIWLRRGTFVLIDSKDYEARENKLEGEITNVVRYERLWKKQPYWPKEFASSPKAADSDEEESTVGKMPPSDPEDDE